MKKQNMIIAGIVFVVLTGICLLAAGLVFLRNRALTDVSRPVVLIHNPVNHDYVEVGSGVIVHSTARSQTDLSRMELWVDDVLIAVQEAPEEDGVLTMVLSSNWVPDKSGTYPLVVRAITADEKEGQAAIFVDALDMVQNEDSGAHVVQVNETLETIAADYGVSPEEISDLNPGLDPGGSPSPGEEIHVPDSEEDQENEPPPEREGEEPSFGGDPPGDRGFFLGAVDSDAEPSDTPTELRLEFPLLETEEAYESLHCYVGYAGSPLQWYPDEDFDQTTDESFSIVETTVQGSISWNIQEYVSGDRVPSLYWTANRPVPFEISCVGITGGGTQALDLGYISYAIEPEEWDGIARLVDVSGPEGGFTLGYRVEHEETPIQFWELDEMMTRPTNLVEVSYSLLGPATGLGDSPGVSTFFASDGGPFALLWDYNPEPEELPIDGFRIYLNGVLQWSESADRMYGNKHYTVFPEQWRHPPCGETYTLTVTAWREGEDAVDGFYESLPGLPPILFETPEEECQNYLNVEVISLETFYMGEDGSTDHQTGDIGPPYGSFYINEDIVTFDTGGPNDDYYPLGLRNNHVYDMQNILLSEWGFSRPLSWTVALDEYGTAVLGFEIWDEDDGLCNDDDDPGCPDLLCSGQEYIGDNYGRPYEAEIWGYNGACKIRISAELAPGSSINELPPGAAPQSSIWIENLVADEPNHLSFQVSNNGSADWTYRTLEIQVVDRVNNHLGTIVQEDLNLETGESLDMEYTSPEGVHASNVCFVLDIESQREINGAPLCPGYPNPVISELTVDVNNGRMLVEVSNTGEGDIYEHDILLEWYTRDGESLGEYIWEDAVLESGETRTFFEDSIVLVPEPYDICASVSTGIETRGMSFARCTPLPDLIVTDVEYLDDGGQGSIDVTIRNSGDEITNRTIVLEATSLPGSAGVRLFEQSFPDTSVSGRVILNVPIPSEVSRDQLRNGYTVVVNPEHTVYESNFDNNDFTVQQGSLFQVFWCGRVIPHGAGFKNGDGVAMDFSASIVSGPTSTLVAHDQWAEEHGYYDASDVHVYNTNSWFQTETCDSVGSIFQIMGDEVLNVQVAATYRAGMVGDFFSIGTITHSFSWAENWGAGSAPYTSESYTDCYHGGGLHSMSNYFHFYEEVWETHYLVCEVR